MFASISHDWRRQIDQQNEKISSKLHVSSNILLSAFFHTQELLTTDSFVAILMTFVKTLNKGRKNSPIGKAGRYKNNSRPKGFHPIETFLYKATEFFQAVIYCFKIEKQSLHYRGYCHREQVHGHALQTQVFGWTPLLGPALLEKHSHLIY